MKANIPTQWIGVRGLAAVLQTGLPINSFNPHLQDQQSLGEETNFSNSIHPVRLEVGNRTGIRLSQHLNLVVESTKGLVAEESGVQET